MTDAINIDLVFEYLEIALETTCAALVGIESMAVRAADLAPDAGMVQGQITRTIDAIRKALTELRSVRGGPASVLGFGFILPADPPRCADQVTPRRTA